MPRRKREILEALASASGWLSRNDIADRTGKRRLSPNDVHHLDALVREARVEAANVGSAGRPEYRYRLISTESTREDK
jgi:predicted ArsR family transcriptional regulator